MTVKNWLKYFWVNDYFLLKSDAHATLNIVGTARKNVGFKIAFKQCKLNILRVKTISGVWQRKTQYGNLHLNYFKAIDPGH